MVGGVLEATLAAMAVPAPGLFSTITVCPIALCSLGARMRARISEVPPGAYGTMMRTTWLNGSAA